jgi:hypothetical protein
MSDRKLVWFAVACAVLLLAGVIPQAVAAAQQAKFVGTGSYSNFYSRYYGRFITAGIFKMQVGGSTGTVYDSYCIDMYKPIALGQTLLVNGDLSDAPGTVDWCAVGYILSHYNYKTTYYSGPLAGLTQGQRAATIQAAIWYVTTDPFGNYVDRYHKYQFMSDPQTGYYDAYFASLPAKIRTAAMGIVNSVPADCDEAFRYPDDLVLEPASAGACTNQVMTATVTDQTGAPLPGIGVVFETDLGSFNDNSVVKKVTVTTGADGKASVTLYDLSNGQTATVTAYATGNYGSFLYDPMNYRQSLTTITLLPTSVSDIAQVSCTPTPPPVGLEISKTAETSLTRTYQWSITKVATPNSHDLYAGETGTSTYTVRVEKTVLGDSNWKVKGTVTIHNPSAAQEVMITGITDKIEKSGSPDIPVTVTACKIGDTPVTVPFPLAAGKTVTCSYETTLPDGSLRTNRVTVTGTVASTSPVDAAVGGSATAPVNFSNAVVTPVNDQITVTDTNLPGNVWGPVSESTTFPTYTKSYTCPTSASSYTGGKHTHELPNTASIVETQQSDDEKVTWNCIYIVGEGIFDKTADEALTENYGWTIVKTADPDEVTLSNGQTATVTYRVRVDATLIGTGQAVKGVITILNPSPTKTYTIDSLTDVVSTGIPATVSNCKISGVSVEIPEPLGPGKTLTCTYSANVPDKADRENTATISVKGVTSSATADVDFDGAPLTKWDDCITVTDTFKGTMGTVCVVDTLPKIFTYTRTVGPYTTCGDRTVDNTATFVTDDSQDTDSADETVTVHVPCEAGCTLTQGYWKTHSHHGPAPEDTAWYNIGDDDGDGTSEGADETFFIEKTGNTKTWYEVFQTQPAGGSVYYQLAHQYMAAKLNILNGASSTPGVDAAIKWAEDRFFSQYAPTGPFPDSAITLAKKYAPLLDDYNNGRIGPGHCPE